jgi:acyl carrier protein
MINEVLESNGDSLISISPEMDLRDDIGMDSLDLAHLTVLIEDEYGVDIFENGIVGSISEILKKING